MNTCHIYITLKSNSDSLRECSGYVAVTQSFVNRKPFVWKFISLTSLRGMFTQFVSSTRTELNSTQENEYCRFEASKFMWNEIWKNVQLQVRNNIKHVLAHYRPYHQSCVHPPWSWVRDTWQIDSSCDSSPFWHYQRPQAMGWSVNITWNKSSKLIGIRNFFSIEKQQDAQRVLKVTCI